MNSNRALARETDEELVALFRSLFIVTIEIGRMVFDQRPLRAIENAYTDPFTRLIERDTRNGVPVFALENATSLTGKQGLVLGIDLGAVRVWTFIDKGK